MGIGIVASVLRVQQKITVRGVFAARGSFFCCVARVRVVSLLGDASLSPGGRRDAATRTHGEEWVVRDADDGARGLMICGLDLQVDRERRRTILRMPGGCGLLGLSVLDGFLYYC